MKGAFIEDFVNTASTDPLSPTHAEFDFAEVERRLGTCGNDGQGEQWAILSEAFNCVGQFMVGKRPLGPGRDQEIGRRTIAVLWLLNPTIFDGQSLSAIARLIGCTPANLATFTADFSRAFKLRFRCQSQGSGRFRPEILSLDGNCANPRHDTEGAADGS